jgi:T-complex protein 1 subunit alpha
MAAMSIANIVKSSLGPVGLDKMMVDDIGDVTISNDGATILRLLEVEHPAARVLVELAQQQDKEVGDGTTSVVIIAAELLRRANDLVKNKIHPTTIITGYRLASKEAVKFIADQMSIKVDAIGKECLINIAKTSMSSKVIGTCVSFPISRGLPGPFTPGNSDANVSCASSHSDDDFFGAMVVDAVNAIKMVGGKGEASYPIKAINILKAHGKSVRESTLIKGYALNNTVASQGLLNWGMGFSSFSNSNSPSSYSAIKTRITNAKIACLDINLQRARMHLGVNIVIDDPNKLEDVRKREIDITMERIKKILDAGANVILTTKGIDDLCLKPFVEAGAMAVRRVKKEDMKRIAKATGGVFARTRLSNTHGSLSVKSHFHFVAGQPRGRRDLRSFDVGSCRGSGSGAYLGRRVHSGQGHKSTIFGIDHTPRRQRLPSR